MLTELIENIPQNAIAIKAAGRTALTFGQLMQTQIILGRHLSGLMISPKDTVVLWLSESPELASAIYCFACHAITFPLNVNATLKQADNYFKMLKPKALVVMRGQYGPIIEVAQQHKMQIIEIETNFNRPAGDFSVRANPKQAPQFQPHKNDMAMSFAQDKKVFSHRQWQVLNKARGNAQALFLRANDSTMNISSLTTPLGAMNFLSVLSVGGAFFASTHEPAMRFLKDFHLAKPSFLQFNQQTWQFMEQAITQNYLLLSAHPCRFLAYSDGYMPIDSLNKWQTAFGVPILTGIQIPEALGLICQMPMMLIKSGTHGLPVQCEFAIFDENTNKLPKNIIGNLMLRSEFLPEFYANDLELTKKAFVKGWFNTSKRAMIDDENYISLLS